MWASLRNLELDEQQMENVQLHELHPCTVRACAGAGGTCPEALNTRGSGC